MASSSTATRDEGIAGCVVYLFSLTGVVLIIVSATNENSGNLFYVGIILFCLPFICAGLGCIFLILGSLTLGILQMFSGLTGASRGEVMKGLLISVTSLAMILALLDIGFNSADMFLSLPFSAAFVGFVIAFICITAKALKMACVKKWGVNLKAPVRKKRRHRHETNNSGFYYLYEVLVTYKVSRQPYCLSFGYQGLPSSTEDSVPTIDNEHQVIMVEESIVMPHNILDVKSLEKTDNAMRSDRRIRKWLTVSQNQYDTIRGRSSMVEVSVLPRYPEVVVTTETLTTYKRWEHVIMLIVLSIFAASFSIPGVFAVREMFFLDKYEFTPRHVQASYVTLATLIPTLLALVIVLPTLSNQGDNDQDLSEEAGLELPTLGLQSEAETVATEETASDLYLDEEASGRDVITKINVTQDPPSPKLPSIT
mmetsp:Transcript_29884/g.45838  ORF Transcript_29884/g.45838 Transcript_29884/m.45838 type:complete len:424 (-) Transcript_29884:99-1370(-)|eukprot:CAMPEP_0195301448 /NCGR_PEP_ID=MMETSP0707-20130614/29324_1 /TAXON_ID=33640 /ORGANISM="Asterionellopsis glacialis, Strain CCMP134" /LENGTH=423 /DNA_ID=CAMNT_0040364395 /DNA_START=107 /DNA_END=1378 /DNA_ORIENTATION=+